MPAFKDLLTHAPGPERTAGLAAWFQGLYDKDQDVPILVGGAAVELYTGGAYVTGDLDFVGSVPSSVARPLKAAGFHEAGRHWIHEAGRIFIELPDRELPPRSQTAKVRVRDWLVLTLSPEDVLLDRLAAWKLWASRVDGVNAFLVWRAQREKLDKSRMQELAAERHVDDALAALTAFARRLEGRQPSTAELGQWARRGP